MSVGHKAGREPRHGSVQRRSPTPPRPVVAARDPLRRLQRQAGNLAMQERFPDAADRVPGSPGPVLRRCSASGECAECRDERLRREARTAAAQAPASASGIRVGAADSPLERAADQLAERILRAVAPTPDPAAEPVAPGRAADGAELGTPAPGIVGEVLATPGRPIEPGTRQFFESRFGRDFSAVRVHSDQRAAASARSVGALAYTVGPHIVFGAGRYAPGSQAGRRLLAHELAHVAQQAPGLARAPPPERAGTSSAADQLATLASTLEGYADQADRRLAAGGSPARSLISGDLAELRVGASRLRAVAAAGDELAAMAALGAFTHESIQAASQQLVPAGNEPVAVAARPAGGLAAKTLDVGSPRSATEIEADRAADAALASQPALLSPDAAPVLRRLLDADAARELAKEAPKVVPVAVAATRLAAPAAAAALAGGPPAWVVALLVVAVVAVVVAAGYLYYRSTQPSPAPAPAPRPPPAPTPTPAPQPVPAPAPRPGPAPAPRTAPAECVQQAERLSTAGCKLTAVGQAGGDPLANLFCEEKTGTQCEFWVSTPVGRARFDAIRGRDVLECKCGYRGLVEAVERGERWARYRLDELLEQLLRHLRVSRHCGLQYRILVSNTVFGEFLRRELGANADVIVTPFEPCD